MTVMVDSLDVDLGAGELRPAQFAADPALARPSPALSVIRLLATE
jgi:hypothetical protein